MHKTGHKSRILRLSILAAVFIIVVAAAISMGMSTVWAYPGYTSPCESCHTYHNGNLRMSIDPSTKTAVNTGEKFAVGVSWTGGGGSRTEVNWPDTQSNTQFAPNPRVPYSSNLVSGSTSSNLTAPSTPGTYTVRVYATQKSPTMESDYKDINITVSEAPPPLSITTTSLASGTVNMTYSQTLVATGGVTPYSWSVSSGSLPAGLSLASGGAITGTPTTAGTSGFNVTVTDNASTTATRVLSITVNPAAPPPPPPPPPALTITTNSLAAGTVNMTYSQTLAATGGVTPYTWSLSAGSLPAGLSVSSTGAITGTPTTEGTSSFTVMVTDNASTTATKALSINVVAPPPPPPPPALTITTNSLAVGTVNMTYSQTLVATGGVTPYSWSVSSGSLPAGLSLASGGAITGTPTTAGTSGFNVTVTDNASTTATRVLSITVNPAAPPPPPPPPPAALTITTNSLAAGTVNMTYNQTLAATGGITPYTWSLSAGSLPAGLSLGSGGAISGTPTTAGSSSFTVVVADNASATASKALSITINTSKPGSGDDDEDDDNGDREHGRGDHDRDDHGRGDHNRGDRDNRGEHQDREKGDRGSVLDRERSQAAFGQTVRALAQARTGNTVAPNSSRGTASRGSSSSTRGGHGGRD